jgi:ArsR family metal-binding transcriptional regulator
VTRRCFQAVEKLIGDYNIELESPACLPGAPVWAAKAQVPNDVSEVMPYLNAVLDRAFYDGDNNYIIWEDDGRKYALRPHELAVGAVLNRDEAHGLVRKAVDKINKIWEQRNEITPDYSKRTPPKLLDILKHLPRTNCGLCGLASCMAFAAELVEGNRCLEDCPPLCEKEKEEALHSLKELGL